LTFYGRKKILALGLWVTLWESVAEAPEIGDFYNFFTHFKA